MYVPWPESLPAPTRLASIRALRALALAQLALACISFPVGCGDDETNADTSPDAMAPADAGTTADARATGDGLNYASRDLWLCHPDLNAADDVCRSTPLDVTAVAADGTIAVKTIERATDPSFDCFYIYPTVSSDDGDNSDLVPDAEIGVTFLQAARYGEVCEVYAPLHRQATLTGLARAVAGDREVLDAAYADVLDAFKQYLEERPDRPFLLLGHSQGSGHLTRLIQEEVEASPALSDRLVAAHLIGPFPSIVVPWNPRTGEIASVGGTFSSTPLCAAADQPGCVVTFSSFRATEPAGVGAFFAVPRPAATPPLIGACTHPAALGGGTAPLSDTWVNGASFETDAESEFSEFGPYVDPASNEALTTAFFSMPGLLSGGCEIQSGHNVLSVVIDADPSDPRVDDIVGDVVRGWGLHLADVSIVLNELVALARSQGEAWATANGR